MRATRELEMAQIGLPPAEALDMKATQPASSSACPISTRGAQVPMWVRPQDEIESHCQELQQSVFQLWKLSH